VIDAVDISTSSIEIARRGFYRRNAFRGDDLKFRARYFTPHDDGWLINDAVKKCVNFRRGNLVDDSAFRSAAYYDVVFCRNVLIYFDRSTQHAVMARVRESLREDGCLFVGPAEAGVATIAGLMPGVAPLAFAFQRRRRMAPTWDAAEPPVTAALASAARGADDGVRALLGSVLKRGMTKRDLTKRDSMKPDPTKPDRTARTVAPVRTASFTVAGTTVRSVVPSSGAVPWPPFETGRGPSASGLTALAQAEGLANQGRLDEANAACRTLLSASGPDADVYALLGVIADASSCPNEAREHFRRAIYLEATHAGALLHLAGHLTMDGDDAGAERLLARARRARPDLF
jgi:chemotaxis protein methyltransferase WspC